MHLVGDQDEMEGLYGYHSAALSDRHLPNDSFLDQDVNSAVDSNGPLSAESDGSSCDLESADGNASLVEAKILAREKFEWLTSHSMVRQSADRMIFHSRWDSPFGPLDQENTGKQQQDSKGNQEEVNEGVGNMRHRSETAAQAAATPLAHKKMATPSSYRSAAQYLSACSRYNLTPNGGALLCLSLGLEMLEVDGTLTNLELVPLCAALLDAPFVQHLKLSGHPLQDTGAAVLALALPGCPWIMELELVGCRITGAGVRSICDAIPKSGIRRLVLRGNMLRQNASTGNTALAAVVERAGRLNSLDLQSCGLTSQGMRLIKRSLADRAVLGRQVCTVDFEGNFVLVEVLNSVTHGACALICLEAWRRLNALIVQLCHFESRIAVTGYIFSMMLMFTGSTLYHSMFAVTDLSWFFRMIDHCAIYFLIAGTYTPVLVMGCRHPVTMVVEQSVTIWVLMYWVMVAIGVVMEHFFAPRKPAWYSKFILSMYVLLGFGGVPYVATCPLVHEADVMVWIELGGLTYVIGIVFFLLDRRYPAMHVIWHLLVGLAAFFHFVAVWNLTNEVLSEPERSCPGQSLWPKGYDAIGELLGWDVDPPIHRSFSNMSNVPALSVAAVKSTIRQL